MQNRFEIFTDMDLETKKITVGKFCDTQILNDC